MDASHVWQHVGGLTPVSAGARSRVAAIFGDVGTTPKAANTLETTPPPTDTSDAPASRQVFTPPLKKPTANPTPPPTGHLRAKKCGAKVPTIARRGRLCGRDLQTSTVETQQLRSAATTQELTTASGWAPQDNADVASKVPKVREEEVARRGVYVAGARGNRPLAARG